MCFLIKIRTNPPIASRNNGETPVQKWVIQWFMSLNHWLIGVIARHLIPRKRPGLSILCSCCSNCISIDSSSESFDQAWQLNTIFDSLSLLVSCVNWGSACAVAPCWHMAAAVELICCYSCCQRSLHQYMAQILVQEVHFWYVSFQPVSLTHWIN